MIVKGVTGGKDKGNAIEYQPVEKFPLAAKIFLHTKAPQGKLYLFDKVKITSSTYQPMGPADHKYANNTYTAEGKIWYKVNELKTDKLSPAKEHDFKISFKDKLSNGIPDLELVEYLLDGEESQAQEQEEE